MGFLACNEKADDDLSFAFSHDIELESYKRDSIVP